MEMGGFSFRPFWGFTPRKVPLSPRVHSPPINCFPLIVMLASIRLYPSRIHDEILRGTHTAVVRGQEKRHGADVLGHETALQTLAALNVLQGVFVNPIAQLPLGHYPAGNQCV